MEESMKYDMLHSSGQFLALICWVFIVAYGAFTLIITYLWSKIRTTSSASIAFNDKITVIVPVRNEESNIENLLRDLSQQNYPTKLFEVLIMDDHSTDKTPHIVNGFIQNSDINFRLLTLPDDNSKSPKKRAIENGIAESTGSLIITTDGDCRVGPNWLSAFVSHYSATHSKLISGPVTFTKENQLTDHLQTVEFASLIGSGAASMEAGYPSMCNGANLMYEKSAFYEVGGFAGVDHLASGDDEFLMHKIASKFPGQISFLKDKKAVVSTQAHNNWTSFFNQRKRWASKWKHYQNKTPLILAIFIFGSNLSLLLSLLLFFSNIISGCALGLMILIKCIPEWFFLGSVLKFLGKKKSWIFIPVTQIIYPFYVCFFGLVAQKPTYKWKGRDLQ